MQNEVSTGLSDNGAQARQGGMVSALADHLDAGGAYIPVSITGMITGVWGRDDGVDQEFVVTVNEITIGSVKLRKPARRDILKRAASPRKKANAKAK